MEIMSPRKTKTTTTTTTSDVANDVIIHILSWVPANSLLRLRWACKYWFHLITRDTSFAKRHLHCSTSTTIHRPHNLSVLISKPLNPLTPSIDYFDDDGPFLPCNTRFGLGYDHSIEDYKVICNVKSFDESLQVGIHVQVYTLRTNSWKYIRSLRTNMSSGFFGNGVFVNGALHFIYIDYPVASRIVSVDFEKEMYVEISNQPECLNYKAKSIQDLTMFEGSLCLTMRTGYTPMEAWVMKKDYNMNNNQEYSWSKLYEIPHIDGIINHLLQPLRFTKDGEILLLDREEHRAEGLLLFDPKNNKITIHKVYKFQPIEKAATAVDTLKIEVIYIESLVSLNSGTYIDEKGDYMHYWQE